MKAMILDAPGGLDRLRMVERPDPGAPGPGMIRVRLHATSLNYHDYGVVAGKMPTEDGRIPMADGAGVVEAVGEGVTDFAAGDAGADREDSPAAQTQPPRRDRLRAAPALFGGVAIQRSWLRSSARA